MNFIFLVLVSVAIIGLFIIKYEVKELDKQLALKSSEVIRSELTIKVLKADWSVLNEPERLRKLGSKHLGLGPLGSGQILELDNIPFFVSDTSERPVINNIGEN